MTQLVEPPACQVVGRDDHRSAAPPAPPGRWAFLALALPALLLANCGEAGPQPAAIPAGDEATRTSEMKDSQTAPASVDMRGNTRSAVDGFRIGHWTHADGTTGCTVVLPPAGTVGAVDVRGGAPASRETDLLRPENMVQEVHAAILSGGSAFGLDAASGVMQGLEEEGVGFETRGGRVPIVVAASLYDLGFGGTDSRPDASCGLAAVAAASSMFEVGSVGAGAGATVGKLGGISGAMRGGLGASSVLAVGGDTVVSALVAANSVGDIIDPSTGRVVAGMQSDGRLLDARRTLGTEAPRGGENTTLGVILTNARLSQAQATKVAQMAHDGMARAIYPSHTPWDGDTLFVLASGRAEGEPDLLRLGARAADAVTAAILDGVRSASPGFGVPTVAELGSESSSSGQVTDPATEVDEVP